MLRIYNYMASGLALTGIVAYLGASTGFYAQLAQTTADLGRHLRAARLRLLLGMLLQAMSYSTAQITFWAFSAVNGAVAVLCLPALHRPASIARTFFITAGTFAG